MYAYGRTQVLKLLLKRHSHDQTLSILQIRRHELGSSASAESLAVDRNQGVGFIHAAGLLKDAALPNISYALLRSLAAPKDVADQPLFNVI